MKSWQSASDIRLLLLRQGKYMITLAPRNRVPVNQEHGKREASHCSDATIHLDLSKCCQQFRQMQCCPEQSHREQGLCCCRFFAAYCRIRSCLELI